MAHFVLDAGISLLRESFPSKFISTQLPFFVPARTPQPVGATSEAG
jgi:hypothetical protein